MTIDALRKKANSLPEKPGVYIMHDISGKVIYVGKAKILKNRVTSYFRNGEHTPKTVKLIENINDFEVIITATEKDALLTECSLIKRYKPQYNILLKNGRGYPFIHYYVENGFPLLTLEGYRTSPKGRYFGPFISGQKAAIIRDLLSRAFNLPQCSRKKRQKKVCLDFHIKRCEGYCTGNVPQTKLDEISEKVCSVLEGNIDEIRTELAANMHREADALEFEAAARLRDRIYALEQLSKQQTTGIVQNRCADYIAHKSQNGKTCIFMLRIRKGYVIAERSDIFDEDFSEALLQQYITLFYTDDTTPPNKIYLEENYDCIPLLNEWLRDKVTITKLSSDTALVKQAYHNAVERMLQFEGRTQRGQRNVSAFCEFSGIENAQHIELYDTSQLAGTDVVCGMVTCIDGLFASDKYKKFKLGQTDANDDTAYMSEAVSRRIKRFADGDEHFAPLPDLIICDGGLGQIHAVENAVHSMGYDIKVVGLKKDSRHRTRSLVFGDGRELALIQNKDVFAFCGKLQEEVHRYAISYHKSLRDEASKKSELTKIEGIGKVRAKALFMRFKSLDKIKNASIEELMQTDGISEKQALIIKKSLSGGENFG